MPYQGDYQTGFADNSPQLSFDITDEKNHVIYSASVPHPIANGLEVFNAPDTITRVIPKEATFAIKVPAIEQAAAIKFYSAGANLNLASEVGRNSRKTLNTIDLKSLKK